MYLTGKRHWACAMPETPGGPLRVHVLTYEPGDTGSLRVGDDGIAELLARPADLVGTMDARTGPGKLGPYCIGEADHRLHFLYHGTTWLAFDPENPPDRSALVQPVNEALVGHFQCTHSSPGMRSDPTEGAGFEYVEEPDEDWHLTCFTDGVVALWTGIMRPDVCAAGRVERHGDQFVIQLGDGITEPLASVDAAETHAAIGESPGLIARGKAILGRIEPAEGASVTLDWGGHRWTG